MSDKVIVIAMVCALIGVGTARAQNLNLSSRQPWIDIMEIQTLDHFERSIVVAAKGSTVMNAANFREKLENPVVYLDDAGLAKAFELTHSQSCEPDRTGGGIARPLAVRTSTGTGVVKACVLAHEPACTYLKALSQLAGARKSDGDYRAFSDELTALHCESGA